MTIISGILRDPAGRPIPNGTIELTALKHTLYVIKTTTAGIEVDNSGFYSMDVAPNEYQVKIQMVGQPPIFVGKICVYQDSPNGTLNSFLNEPGEEDLTSENLKIFQNLSQATINAANEAKQYAAGAEQVVSDANIGNIVNREMRKILHVDCQNGNDNNDGLAPERPLKTLVRASELTAPGSATVIKMMRDYTFSPDEIVNFYNSAVVIQSYKTNARVKIKFNYYVLPQYPDTYYMSSFLLSFAGSIEFYSIDLELPNVPPDHAPGKIYTSHAAVLRANASLLATTLLSVRLYSVNIIVPEPERSGWNFIGNGAAMTSLFVTAVTMPAAWRDRNKMILQSRLSTATITKSLINTSTVLSNDPSVYNNGSVSE